MIYGDVKVARYRGEGRFRGYVLGCLLLLRVSVLGMEYSLFFFSSGIGGCGQVRVVKSVRFEGSY